MIRSKANVVGRAWPITHLVFFSALWDRSHQSPLLLQHIGDLYQRGIDRGLNCSWYQENGAIVNLTRPDDLLLMNAIEFRRIAVMRPKEKQKLKNILANILSENTDDNPL